MKIRTLFVFVFSLALAGAALAQDQNAAPPAPQGNRQGPGGGGFGRGGFGGGMGMGGGRSVMGTVTEAAADHFTVKTETGETYTVKFSATTRLIKMQGGGPGGGGVRPGGGQGQGAPGQGGQGQGGQGGFGGGMGRGGNPPQQIKATDIKVGDAITASGEIDATAKSVGAVMIVQLDPERAKQMAEMQANFGKTWLQGKVTAIEDVKVTLTGTQDNAPHSFVADENTTFRKRRDPITLADIQVGDMVRADGAVKDGVFTATAVSVMGGGPGGPGGGPDGPGGGPAGGPPSGPPSGPPTAPPNGPQ